MMKKNILQTSLLLINFVSAISAFYSISRAIRISEASTWLVPMFWIFIFLLSTLLIGILVRSRVLAELVVSFSVLVSFLFVLETMHLAISILAISMVLAGLHAIKKDLDLNVKISLWKSLYLGKFKIVLALAVLISSQYYFTVKSMEGMVNVPRFNVSEITDPLVMPILGVINPEFSQAGKQGLTVDQFIIQTQQNQQLEDESVFNEELIEANMPQGLNENQKQILKQQALAEIADAKTKMLEQNHELILQEGRKQFSKMMGRNVEGNEQISSVFSGMINDKINAYFQPVKEGGRQSSFYPLVLSMILFLTIWPLGSLLSTICFGVTILFFRLFVKFGLVEIKKVMVEREMIS